MLTRNQVDDEPIIVGQSPLFAYLRIERSIRTAMRRRHLPMGVLMHIERQIVEFFSVDSDGVMVTTLPDRLAMLLPCI